ncbi:MULTISPECIES: hypothetical protein [Streptomyces]|uniref:Uncharacterized protein n=1 Tax=Streptomyces cavourensis TaxID=67258 RepID=A0ABY5FIW9_9ACTN|nr:hypothetical protein [Streptomyces cavourensis]UTR83525.1 hypothetical protein NLU04_21035 [Streptomyces cavourensis]WST20014.1 hypothetical protein OG721_06090 [Streptomyces microflavus]SCK25929.1 hypothetical protein YUYDRAFT_02820 [Streptomyces sp. ScaeMP-e48]
MKTLREHEPDFVLLDGVLAECDRVGDGWADYSHKRRRHGVNGRPSPIPVDGCYGSRPSCRAARTT